MAAHSKEGDPMLPRYTFQHASRWGPIMARRRLTSRTGTMRQASSSGTIIADHPAAHPDGQLIGDCNALVACEVVRMPVCHMLLRNALAHRDVKHVGSHRCCGISSRPRALLGFGVSTERAAHGHAEDPRRRDVFLDALPRPAARRKPQRAGQRCAAGPDVLERHRDDR